MVPTMVTTMGLMQGISVIQPESTLPTVLVIPTTEIKKEAFSAENPMFVAICKKVLLVGSGS